MVFLKVLQYVVGFGLITLGIAGLFLPLLQGILMILLGVLVLRADKLSDVWPTIKKKLGIKQKK